MVGVKSNTPTSRTEDATGVAGDGVRSIRARMGEGGRGVGGRILEKHKQQQGGSGQFIIFNFQLSNNSGIWHFGRKMQQKMKFWENCK